MKEWIVLAASLFALTGCQTALSDSVAEKQTPPTAAIKQAVVRAFYKTGLRGKSIYGSKISSVVLIDPAKNIGLFCISATDREYNYPVRFSLSFKDGKGSGVVMSDTRCQDGRLKYYPFPELNNMAGPAP